MNNSKYRKFDEVFFDVASMYPERLAIKDGEHKLTYKELVNRSLNYYQNLEEAGLAVGDFVCVDLVLSAELVALCIGMSRIGVIPYFVSEQTPEGRRKALKDIVSPTITINSNSKIMDIGDKSRVQELKKYSDDRAFIAFTSGTTASPKGIMMSHSGMTHFATNQIRVFNAVDQKIMVTTKPGGDPFYKEILFGLLSGGTLILPNYSRLKQNKVSVLQWIRENKVDVVQTVPSIIREWLREDELTQLDTLDIIALAGEKLEGSLTNDLYKRTIESCSIYNFYGPTESTITKTFYKVPKATDLVNIPIGKPISDTQIYILDKNNRQLVAGRKGQIAILSNFMSHGYLDQENCFTEIIVDDAKELVYLTGDYGKKSEDGTLLFLGRIDDEIKILGNRVLPQEIESVVSELPQIETACVIFEEQNHEIKNILLFYSLKQELSTRKVFDYLVTSLPSYMVPHHLYPIRDWPMAPNGKVSKSHLKEVHNHSHRQRIAGEKDSDEYDLLRSIFESSTGIEPPKPTENLLSTGVHSLQMIAFAAQLKSSFNLDLKIIDIYRNPSLVEIANLIKENENNSSMKNTRQVLTTSNLVKAPLMRKQYRLFNLEVSIEANGAYNVPVVFETLDSIDLKLIKKCLKKSIERYPVSNSKLERNQDKVSQSIVSSKEIDIKTIKFIDGSMVKMIETEVRRPFDLLRENLFRATLIDSEGKLVIILNWHHIIADAWSVSLFLNYFTKILSGAKADLSAGKTHFYTMALSESQTTNEEDLRFWEKELVGIGLPVSIPYDIVGNNNSYLKGNNLFVSLPPKLCSKVIEFAKNGNFSVYSFLMTCFMLLLAKKTKQYHVCVGTDNANRKNMDDMESFGYFVNTLFCSYHFKKEQTILSAIRETSNKLQQNENHSNTDPFTVLEDKPGLLADNTHFPLFKSMFRMFSGLMKIDNKESIEGQFLNFDTGTTKFDLTLSLTEVNGKIFGEIEYSDKYRQKTVEGLFSGFTHIVESVCDHPQEKINSIRFSPRQNHRKRIIVRKL